MLYLNEEDIKRHVGSDGYFTKQNVRYSVNDHVVLEQTYRIDLLEDGMYTFVITAKGEMILSQVRDSSENGSKHLQLCHSTDEQLFAAGGELYKHDTKVYFNLYSSLFEPINDVNIVSHTEQLFEMILTCFMSHIDKKETEIFYFIKD